MIYIVRIYDYSYDMYHPSKYIAGVFNDLKQLENELYAQGICLGNSVCEYNENGTLTSAYDSVGDVEIYIDAWTPNVLDDITSEYDIANA